MKYKINYMLAGGGTTIETLPNAFSIYEFKSSLILLPKAIKQNASNLANSMNGAFQKNDEHKKMHFKTDDTTKTIILINDKHDNQFNGLFLEPRDTHRLTDDLITNNKIDKLCTLIESNLKNIYDICQNSDNNIYIIDKNGSINPILDSELWTKFNMYKTTFNNIDNNKEKSTFLINRLKLDETKKKYIQNYLLQTELEKNIQYSESIKKLLKKYHSKHKYREKKIYPYNHILKDIKKLTSDEKLIFDNEYQKLNNIKKGEICLVNIQIEINDYISNSGAVGNNIGISFEQEIEDNIELQRSLVNTIDGLDTYKPYFNYTWGTSDIDMTVVKI